MEKETTKKNQTKKNQVKTDTKKKNHIEEKKKVPVKKNETKTGANKKNRQKTQKNETISEKKVSKNVEEEVKFEDNLEEIEELDELDEDEKEEKVEVSHESSSKKKGKTSDLILLIALVAVVILGFVFMQGKKVEPSYELPLTLTGETGLHELSYAEYQEKIDNDESFVVIIERATCSHCVNYMPVAEEFAKDNSVPMYYVDTDTFTDEDWESFEKSNTFLKKNSGNWGTPTTVVLAGNEAVDYIEGETTADSLLELYDKYFETNAE